jgi:hypothetical protein
MGKRSSPSVTAPWWWSEVEAAVAPEVVAVARKLGLTADSTSQRIWAVLRTMVDPYFPTEPIKLLFPEIDVATVPLWDQRKVFAAALRDRPESSIAHAALAHLGARVREGTIPALPRRRSTPGLARDWRVLFSRSTQGPAPRPMRRRTKTTPPSSTAESRASLVTTLVSMALGSSATRPCGSFRSNLEYPLRGGPMLWERRHHTATSYAICYSSSRRIFRRSMVGSTNFAPSDRPIATGEPT